MEENNRSASMARRRSLPGPPVWIMALRMGTDRTATADPKNQRGRPSRRTHLRHPSRRPPKRRRCNIGMASLWTQATVPMWTFVTQGKIWDRWRRKSKSPSRCLTIPVSQYLDKCRGVRTMKDMHFKSEVAQRELSDLQRIPSAL
jgi:hypothetical protein